VLVICFNFLLAGIDAFIFHREIKYDIILHCHIFYPVAEYVALFEYTRCLLFYGSLSIWFTFLFIYYLLICLSNRDLTLSNNGDLSVRDFWEWRKNKFLWNRNVYHSEVAFIYSVVTKICSKPNVLLARVALQLCIRRFWFRISTRVLVIRQTHSN